MKFDGLFIFLVGLILLLSRLGFFNANFNVLMFILGGVLIALGIYTFIQANKK